MRMHAPVLTAFGIVVITTVLAGQQGTRGGEWTRYGGDAGSTKYAPLDQINKGNLSQLRIAWRRPAVDSQLTARAPDLSYSGNFRATPLMIDGVLYSPNAIGLVEAFHPGTGQTIWVQEPFPDEPGQGLRGDSARGVGYWTDGTDRRLFLVRGEYLIALDLRSG
jgi:quinoprotein glucose dehydrogenase